MKKNGKPRTKDDVIERAKLNHEESERDAAEEPEKNTFGYPIRRCVRPIDVARDVICSEAKARALIREALGVTEKNGGLVRIRREDWEAFAKKRFGTRSSSQPAQPLARVAPLKPAPHRRPSRPVPQSGATSPSSPIRVTQPRKKKPQE